MRSFPHLSDRAERLKRQFDLPPRTAEWVAAVAVHSGSFLRSQYCEFAGCSRTTAKRFVEGLCKRGLALEYDSSWGRVCRITRQKIYRALDAYPGRYYRQASWPLMHRRLLALDYVLDYPELPWLPTEAEKLAVFDSLGVPREELQRRAYQGIVPARLYFPDKHPIAIDIPAQAAVFVYVDIEEQTPQGLKSWRRAHDALWRRLSAAGFRLKVAHVSSNPDLSEQVYRSFQWMGSRMKNAGMSPDEARRRRASNKRMLTKSLEEREELKAAWPRTIEELAKKKERQANTEDMIIRLRKLIRELNSYIEQYGRINWSISHFQARLSKRIRPSTENRDRHTEPDADESWDDC